MKLIITILLLILTATVLYGSDECIDKAQSKFKQGKYKEAINILNECTPSIIDDKDPLSISKLYYGLGMCYFRLGDLENALKYHLRSLDVKEKFDIEERLNQSYNDLGLVYQYMGLYQKSIYYYNKAIRLNIGKNLKQLSYNYNNIAISYEKLDFLDSAEHYYNIALSIIDEEQNEFKYKVYNNVAFLYERQGNYNDAKRMFNKSLGIKDYNPDLHSMFLLNIQILNIKFGKGYDKNIIHQFYFKYKGSSNVDYRSYSYYCMSIVLAIENDYIKAEELLSQSIISLLNEGLYKESIDHIDEFIALENTYNLVPIISNKFKLKRIELYKSNLIQLNNEYSKDIEIASKNERYVDNLSSELKFAKINSYILASILLLILLSANFGYKWIKKNRLLKNMKILLNDINNERDKSENYAINNLGKLMYMIDMRLNYEENSKIFDTIDETIERLNDKRRNIDSDLLITNKEL
ncbi:MAG: tetratricopeptide repeat protein [Candidatus Kapaibacterium sp.]